jgi:hypothetical protein
MVSDMPDVDPVKFGLLIGQVKTLESQVSDLQKDVKQLLAIANKAQGAMWLALLIVSGLSGIVSYIVSHAK